MDIIDLIAKLQGLGVAGLALAALFVTNRFWVRKQAEAQATHAEELAAVRAEHQARIDQLSGIIDQKNNVIEELSTQRVQAGEARREDMERFLTRDVEREVRYELLVAQFSNMATQTTTAIKELKDEIRRG